MRYFPGIPWMKLLQMQVKEYLRQNVMAVQAVNNNVKTKGVADVAASFY